MPYGTPKIPISELKRLILDDIRENLEKNPLFQNSSLSFYQVEADYVVTLKVTARGQDKETIKNSFILGEVPAEEKRGPEKDKPEAMAMKTSGHIEKGEKREVVS